MMETSAELMEKRRRKRRFCHGLLITVVLLAILAAVCLWIHVAAEARHVLREAKNAQLAVKLVSIEYYGLEKQIYDRMQPSGLTEEALEDIRYYSAIRGDLFVVSISENGLDPAGMVYISENGYVATFGIQESGWVVSRPLRLSARTKEKAGD